VFQDSIDDTIIISQREFTVRGLEISKRSNVVESLRVSVDFDLWEELMSLSLKLLVSRQSVKDLLR
jgi:hypothetical protein